MTMSSAVSPLASHSFVHGIPNAFRIWLNVDYNDVDMTIDDSNLMGEEIAVYYCQGSIYYKIPLKNFYLPP